MTPQRGDRVVFTGGRNNEQTGVVLGPGCMPGTVEVRVTSGFAKGAEHSVYPDAVRVTHHAGAAA